MEKNSPAPAREAVRKLNRYWEMLIDWNGRMDLTSVPPQEMAERHFLDSLLPLRDTPGTTAKAWASTSA